MDEMLSVVGAKGTDQGDEDAGSDEQAWSLSLDPHPVSQCSIALRKFLAFEQCSGFRWMAVDYFLVFNCV